MSEIGYYNFVLDNLPLLLRTCRLVVRVALTPRAYVQNLMQIGVMVFALQGVVFWTKCPFFASRTTVKEPHFGVHDGGHSFKAIVMKLWESAGLVVNLVLKLGQKNWTVITKVMTVLSFLWRFRQPSCCSTNIPLGTYCCLDIPNTRLKFQANPSYGSSVTVI